MKLKKLFCAVTACVLGASLLVGCSGKDKESGKKFVITLYPDIAPITCENFEKLVNDKFYDGLTFHRVIDDFMAQGGDPADSGKKADTIKGEFLENGVENDLSHRRGIVSMARTSLDMDSASSQFFICYTDCSFLDGSYAAFGEVTSGMDVVDGFLTVEREEGADGYISSPLTPIKIISARMGKEDSSGNPTVEFVVSY